MKTRKQKKVRTILLIIGILIVPLLKIHAEDLRTVTRLNGYWKFSVGDRMEWTDPDYNDNHWDEIRVPESWEREGYDDYNGFAWYRKKFRLGNLPANEQYYLVLGNIDDCDEVFFNGQLIGKSGSFPPHFITAYNVRRKYPIPPRLLRPNADNHVAVRVYDSYLGGGIVGGPVGIYSDDDIEYLDLDLTGNWKFHIGNDREWKLRNIDETGWDEVHVPASWESQGYEDYDGYAWYRKDFRLPAALAGEKLYLSLGKIDDYDRVFLNGQEIGEVYDLEKDGEYRRSGYEYNARRVYPIPEDLLTANGKNTIAIRVYDKGLVGGIYEGPIGIMNEENYKDYRRKYRNSRGFWDYVFDVFAD